MVFALSAAEGVLTRTGGHALVIGADLYSRILNRADRRTVILFGDGAGAVVMGPSVGHGPRIRHLALHSFGELSGLIEVPAGGSRMPVDQTVLDAGLQYFAMDGRGVRNFVGDHLPQLVKGSCTNAMSYPTTSTTLYRTRPTAPCWTPSSPTWNCLARPCTAQ